MNYQAERQEEKWLNSEQSILENHAIPLEVDVHQERDHLEKENEENIIMNLEMNVNTTKLGPKSIDQGNNLL